jgi:hypothetical protein
MDRVDEGLALRDWRANSVAYFNCTKKRRLTDSPPEYVTAIAAGREPELPTDLSAVLVMRED